MNSLEAYKEQLQKCIWELRVYENAKKIKAVSGAFAAFMNQSMISQLEEEIRFLERRIEELEHKSLRSSG